MLARSIREAVVLVGLTGCGLVEVTAPRPVDDSPADRTPAYVLTAERLASDYVNGRRSADARYLGRYVEVRGVVDRVTMSTVGHPRVTLVGCEDAELDDRVVKEVRCLFAPDQRERAAELLPRQRVMLRGRCEGETTSFAVELADCDVVEVGPDPALAVTVAQLARDYLANRAEADQKYKGQPLVVDGTFLELQADDLSATAAVLQAVDDNMEISLRVVGFFGPDQKAVFEKVVRGQRIWIRGEGRGLVDGVVFISHASLVVKKP